MGQCPTRFSLLSLRLSYPHLRWANLTLQDGLNVGRLFDRGLLFNGGGRGRTRSDRRAPTISHGYITRTNEFQRTLFCRSASVLGRPRRTEIPQTNNYDAHPTNANFLSSTAGNSSTNIKFTFNSAHNVPNSSTNFLDRTRTSLGTT